MRKRKATVAAEPQHGADPSPTASCNHRATVLEPGDEIIFSTQWFVDYPNGFYNMHCLKIGPLPKRGPAPGTQRYGVVTEVVSERAVLVQIISGRQRGRVSWVPLDRVVGKTGERHAVPDIGRAPERC
jgi:hypothetical protein